MLKLEHLSFSYVYKPLFSDLNLNVEQGGVCGLLGKNGSGKTTLLKLIAGLAFADQGQSQVMGYDPSQRSPAFLENIYFLPEEMYLPRLTAMQYIQCYAIFYPAFDHDFFKQALQEFDLPCDKLLTNLSYGQKKKFLLSFGLAANTQLLILDEPTNGLDIPSKAQFRKLVASTISKERLFIISTHQVHDVENIIDSVVVLDEGKIIFNQTIMEMSKQLAFVIEPIIPEQAFYYEKRLGGYAAVIRNISGADAQIDLELFFNAVLTQKTQLQQLFDKVKS